SRRVSCRPQGPRQGVDRLRTPARREVPVDVHRDADLAVAEQLLYVLERHARLTDQEAAGQVPEVVQADRRQTGLVEEPLVLAQDAPSVERRAGLGREHVALAGPRDAEPQQLGLLLRPPAKERLGRTLRDAARPTRLLRLRLADHEFAGDALDRLA